jgi:hypothetical protein
MNVNRSSRLKIDDGPDIDAAMATHLRRAGVPRVSFRAQRERIIGLRVAAQNAWLANERKRPVSPATLTQRAQGLQISGTEHVICSSMPANLMPTAATAWRRTFRGRCLQAWTQWRRRLACSIAIGSRSLKHQGNTAVHRLAGLPAHDAAARASAMTDT